MKPECLECEATLQLALERVKRLEEAVVVLADRAEMMPCGCSLREIDGGHRVVCAKPVLLEAVTRARAALRPEGT